MLKLHKGIGMKIRLGSDTVMRLVEIRLAIASLIYYYYLNKPPSRLADVFH